MQYFLCLAGTSQSDAWDFEALNNLDSLRINRLGNAALHSATGRSFQTSPGGVGVATWVIQH